MTNISLQDNFEQPPWKKSIDKCLEDVKNQLFDYLESEQFMFEWKHWDFHRGGVASRFRDVIQNYLRKSKFPIKTKTLGIIIQVIEHSLCAQMNFMYETLPQKIMMENDLVKMLGQIIIEESFNIPSLVQDMYREYRPLWNAAKKIQLQWRKAISDPSYSLCQKRLKFEN